MSKTDFIEATLRQRLIELYGECPEPKYLERFFREMSLLKESGAADGLLQLAGEFERIIEARYPPCYQENQGGSLVLGLLGIKESKRSQPNSPGRPDRSGEVIVGKPMLPMDLRRGELTILAGRPGTGKTMTAWEASAMAAAAGERVLYFSFDEDAESIRQALRYRCRDNGLDNITIDATNELEIRYDLGEFECADRYDVLSEHIDLMCGLHSGVALVVIDFIQAFSYTHDTMDRLRHIADYHDCAILIISSASRTSEGRPLQSGDIDPALLNGADQIIGLYRTWNDVDKASCEEISCAEVVP